MTREELLTLLAETLNTSNHAIDCYGNMVRVMSEDVANRIADILDAEGL